MKKSKFSEDEEEIAYTLRQVESGTTAVDVCRQQASASKSKRSLVGRSCEVRTPQLGWRRGHSRF